MTIRSTCSACGLPIEVGEESRDGPCFCHACGESTRPQASSAPASASSPGLDAATVRGQPALSESRAWVRWASLEPSRVQGLAGGLLVLGTIDLLVTFSLLRRSAAFFEANPVAQWFFARWNMTGMVLFKFAVLGFVIAASELIERRRPGWGQVVLVIGCLGTLYAIYKGYTLHVAGEPPQTLVSD